MSLTFGVDQLCRFCDGSGTARERDCGHCSGTGLEPSEKAVARRSDPETSHAAAASLSAERLRSSQAFVLDRLTRYGPMTDDRLVTLCGGALSPSGARTRRAELVALGKVVDTGRTETLPSGRKAIVWAAA